MSNDLPKRTLREHWNDPMFRAVIVIFLMMCLALTTAGLFK